MWLKNKDKPKANKGGNMKNTGSLVAIIAVSLLCFAIVIVGSVKKRPVIIESNATADEIVDNAVFDSSELGGGYLPEVTTILADNGRLVIGTDNGLYLMPISDSAVDPKPEPAATEPEIMCLNVILPLGDSRFVGSYNGLHKLDNNYAIAFESYYPGETVYALLEFGDGILVGTDRGLWFHCDEPIDESGCQDTLLLDNVIVTALETDYAGLWVGTYGDGLFFNDGRSWQQRYLLRDTLSFAFVNALEYRYPYLWVGTEKAIFRYNGGRWSQMFEADSSEIQMTTVIVSTPAATYIGTERGLLRCIGDTLRSVPEFEGMAVAAICPSGPVSGADEKDFFVATRNDGIFTFNKKEEIVSPEQLTIQASPEDINKEVLAETNFEGTK
jgi:ligand-binding sensor domain-containing protein